MISGKIATEGINIMTFSSVANDDVFTQNYKFMISPYLFYINIIYFN